jgi:hypothetical protein
VCSQVASQSAIPVQLTCVEVGPGAAGREIVCFDISQYGDHLPQPLRLQGYKHIRTPGRSFGDLALQNLSRPSNVADSWLLSMC